MTQYQTEAQFSQAVIEFARANGWLVYHTWRSDHSEAGFPDLTLVRDGELRFAELKRDGKHVTQAQAEWLGALAGAKIKVAVWRPSDWESIEETLGR